MILVTGATGNTGRALVELLARRPARVRALVHDPAKAADLAMPNVEVVIADLGAPHTLARALDGVGKAYLLSSAHPRQVELHGNFIRAAKLAGVRHIVRHSVRGADADSPIKICRWHAESQRELESSGIAWTHLQPVYNMQNILKLARVIRSQGVLAAPMKDGAVSMVDARDVAAVAAACLTGDGHEGRTYLVTGPQGITFSEVALHLSQGLDMPVRYVDASAENARTGMLMMGMPDWYVDDLLGFYAWYSTGASAAVSDVVQTMAGRAGRSFSQFVAEHRSGFLKAGL
jgi:uncharacterized protein YbjT (DUF2867 family)